MAKTNGKERILTISNDCFVEKSKNYYVICPVRPITIGKVGELEKSTEPYCTHRCALCGITPNNWVMCNAIGGDGGRLIGRLEK